MRAQEFILEYNQAKTAQNYGSKMLAALGQDTSRHFPNALGSGGAEVRAAAKNNEKLSQLTQNTIVNDLLTALEDADPTNNKAYVQWLVQQYIKGNPIEDIISNGTDWLSIYHQLKTKKLLPANTADIGRLSFGDLGRIATDADLLKKLDAPAKSNDKGDAREVFSNDQVRIIQPMNEAAAMYYGQGTTWCTAATNNNMFQYYNNEGPIFILLPKHPKYTGEKYQIQFDSSQYMNEEDKPVNLIELLEQRFGDITDIFSEFINYWVLFADDNLLEKLLKETGELMSDQIMDQLSQWEASDDYYYSWLIEKGYQEEDGDINWDQVYKDGNGYIEFSDEAKKWYNDLNNFFAMPISNFKAVVNNVQEDRYNEDPLAITEFEDVVALVMREELENNQAIADDIADLLSVKALGKGQYKMVRS